MFDQVLNTSPKAASKRCSKSEKLNLEKLLSLLQIFYTDHKIRRCLENMLTRTV